MKTLNFIPIVYMLNLQLFAVEHNTNTTTQTGAGQDLSAEMKTFYDKNLIRLAEPNLVHDQFAQKRPIPKNGGKTIEFRKYSPLTKVSSALEEGVSPIGNKLDVQTITSTVAQYGDYIAVSDMLDLTALDNNIAEAQDLLGSQAGLSLDAVVRNVLMTGNNVHYCRPITEGVEGEAPFERANLTKASQLTMKEIQRVVATLAAQNTPKIGDSYVGIIHPFAKFDLMNDENWQEWNKYTSADKMYKNEIGKIAGVRFVESSEAKIFAPEILADGLSRLTVAADVNGSTSVKVSESLTAASFVGKNVYVGGVENTLISISNDGNETSLVLATAATCKAGDVICGKGGSRDGSAVFATLIFGDKAYGSTEITGGGLQTFVKPLGSGGSEDPLNQRATVGWKATKTAEILVPQYLVRVESCSAEFSDIAQAN